MKFEISRGPADKPGCGIESDGPRYDNPEKLKSVIFERIDEKDIPEEVRKTMTELFVDAARAAHPDFISTLHGTDTSDWPDPSLPFDHCLKFTDERVTSFIVSAKVPNLEKPAECVLMEDVENGKIIGGGTLGFGTIGPIPETEYPFLISHSNYESKDGKEIEKRGLGTRRLMLFNAYCKQFYGKLLRASNDLSATARGVWQRLERLGLARPIDKVDLNGRQRYQFIDDQS